MDNGAVQLVGNPCGQHGPYTFYKAFKYVKKGLKRIVKLSEFFFVKLWSDSDLVCIGELQLLWVDKNSEQVLSSLRLYFLPENTPEGRMDHGEDEVLAISEKVVLRLEDLVTWITVDAEWSWGRLAKCETDSKEPKKIENDLGINVTVSEKAPDAADVEKERLTTDDKANKSTSVVILSYPTYCRYRAMMKRLEGVEDENLKHTIVKILGGLASQNKNTRILFCRDTFDYPELEGHELLCNHLAPKLKGRPRGRRKKRSISPGSESNESESSICNLFSTNKSKLFGDCGINGLRSEVMPRRSTRSSTGNSESKEFLKRLSVFMKANHTPIGRIPSLGYRELDLYSFYTKVDKLGGYNAVTTNRLWKSIFDDLSSNYISTSAATVIRRHYERFLLPYERHLKGQEYKPSTSLKRNKSLSGSSSDIDGNESTTSCSDAGASASQLTVIPIPPVPSTSGYKIPQGKEKKESKTHQEVKPASSLRSIRVKPDRLRDPALKVNSKSPKPESTISNVDNEFSVNIKSEAVSPLNSPTETNIGNNGLTVELIPTPISNDVDTNDSVKTGKTAPPKVTSEKPLQPSFIAPSSIIIQRNDKVTAPAEGKENIATCNTNLSGVNNNNNSKKDTDLTEVPYKSKTPETINLDIEASNNNIITNVSLDNSLLPNVKKRKLEILKEGGLEVTPVKPVINTLEIKEVKESRPTVIHHPTISAPTTTTTTVGQLSITLATERSNTTNSVSKSERQLLPQPTKDIPTIPSPNTVRTNPKAINKNLMPSQNTHLYLNGHSPPKVVQSKSIYSYSEKTVYGNPKDYFMPPPQQPLPQTPKFVDSSPIRQRGGEILDLTIRSPQKPMVEIMKVPNVASRFPISPKEASSKMNYRNSAALPVLDARVGSNLEITLVAPNATSHSMQQKPMSRYNSNSAFVTQSSANMHHSNVSGRSGYNMNINKLGQKRTFSGTPVTHKKGENGRLPYSVMTVQQPYAARDQRHNINNNNTVNNDLNSYRNSLPKLDSSRSYSVKSLPQPYAAAPSSVLPGYLTQLSLASKVMPPYVPPIDPLYYSALQSLYPHSPLTSVSPFFPVPTPEQLQFYTDLMTRNSSMRFPFPYPSDSNSGLTANVDNFKKQ